MQDFFEQLKAAREGVGLGAERKQRIRNRLVQVMHEHPVAERRWWSVRWIQVATACVVLVALSGVSSAYAAHQALPGDLLYPVKIHINEAVAAALKRTPQDKAAYAVQRASARLEEVDQLALSQKLDAKTRQMAEQNVSRQIDEAEQRIEAVAATGDAGEAVELHTGLAAVLTAHERVMGSLQQGHSSGDANSQELESLRQNVRAALRRANQASGSADGDNQKKPSSHTDNSQTHADTNGPSPDSTDVQISTPSERRHPASREEAQNILHRATTAYSRVPDSVRQGNGDFQRVDLLLAAAQKSYDGGEYPQAISQATEALLAIQERNILNGVNRRLRLDVHAEGGGSRDGGSSHNEDR